MLATLNGLKPQLGEVNDRFNCGIRECVEEHERQHIEDMLATSYGSQMCKNQGINTRATFNTGNETWQSEINASVTQRKCIERKLKEHQNSGVCKIILENEIISVEQYEKKFKDKLHAK